jgi:hypothetical protein
MRNAASRKAGYADCPEAPRHGLPCPAGHQEPGPEDVMHSFWPAPARLHICSNSLPRVSLTHRSTNTVDNAAATA